MPLARRLRWLLPVAIIASLVIGTGVASGQTVTLRLQAVSPSVAPNGTLEVDVFLDNPSGTAIGGYQIAVAYPTDLLQPSAAPQSLAGETVLDDVFSWNAPAPLGLGFGNCPLWDDGSDLDVVAAIGVGGPFTGTSGHLFRLSFQCLGANGATGTLIVNNVTVVCLNWAGSFAVTPLGAQIASASQNENVVVTNLAPITNLTCVIEPVSGNAQINWSNGATYDNIRIYRGSNGQLLTTLPGTASAYLDPMPSVTSADYFVTGVVNSVEAPWVSCSPVVVVMVPPVENLTCTANIGVVNLMWTNPAIYTQIEVYRTGVLVGTLGGVATSFADTGAGSTGDVSYFVIGYDGPNQAPGASCSVSLGGVSFIRGDANDDGSVNVSDVQASLSYIFGLPNNVTCVKAADFTDNGTVAINDPVQLLTFLFNGGAPPPAPFPMPGVDPTPDVLPCVP